MPVNTVSDIIIAQDLSWNIKLYVDCCIIYKSLLGACSHLFASGILSVDILLFCDTAVLLNVNTNDYKQKIGDAVGNYFETDDMYSCNAKFDVNIQSNISNAFRAVRILNAGF